MKNRLEHIPATIHNTIKLNKTIMYNDYFTYIQYTPTAIQSTHTYCMTLQHKELKTSAQIVLSFPW